MPFVGLRRQYYNRLPIRKKWKRAIMKGTMVMCDRTGQAGRPDAFLTHCFIHSTGLEKEAKQQRRFESHRWPSPVTMIGRTLTRAGALRPAQLS